MTLSLADIEARLARHDPHRYIADSSGRQAGVAVILRTIDEGTPEVLFIKRAERPGDPWSGHMAFPGGHREAEDADLPATATRETFEEIGLDLRRNGRFLAELDQTRAQPRNRRLDLVIGPSAFQLEDPSVEPTLNYEVAEVIWLPLATLMSNELHQVRKLEISGEPFDYNGFHAPGGYFIWGLTYRMLKQFFRVLDPAWRSLDKDEFDEFRR